MGCVNSNPKPKSQPIPTNPNNPQTVGNNAAASGVNNGANALNVQNNPPIGYAAQ